MIDRAVWKAAATRQPLTRPLVDPNILKVERPTSELVPFRFDAGPHHYTALDTGEVLPHITGMMKRCGYIDDRWFTEESRIRGTGVHKRAEQFDLGLIDPAKVKGKYRGWFLAYLAALDAIRPTWALVEERIVHPEFRFAGTLDRLGLVYAHKAIVDLKSGVKLRSHGIQTALQAFLASSKYKLPPSRWHRFSLYLRENGRFYLHEHDSRSELMEAEAIIVECCGKGGKR